MNPEKLICTLRANFQTPCEGEVRSYALEESVTVIACLAHAQNAGLIHGEIQKNVKTATS